MCNLSGSLLSWSFHTPSGCFCCSRTLSHFAALAFCCSHSLSHFHTASIYDVIPRLDWRQVWSCLERAQQGPWQLDVRRLSPSAFPHGVLLTFELQLQQPAPPLEPGSREQQAAGWRDSVTVLSFVLDGKAVEIMVDASGRCVRAQQRVWGLRVGQHCKRCWWQQLWQQRQQWHNETTCVAPHQLEHGQQCATAALPSLQGQHASASSQLMVCASTGLHSSCQAFEVDTSVCCSMQT